MKRKKTKYQRDKEECDKLWSKLVKLRAGNKSEISNKTEYLHSHHLVGKSNFRLRYELENGYCCTAGEHKFGFHNPNRIELYRQMVIAQRGEDVFMKLNRLRNELCKTKVFDVKVYLLEEMKKYE